jgi:beta-aspartyl-dipeptidase (metallo-type)
MFTLVKNGTLYSPEYKGKLNIVICMGKIVSIGKEDDFLSLNFSDKVKIIDAKGMIIIPGFIDQHMHFLGGGGKLGYSSRAGIIEYNDIIRFGVTTAIGSLGVDSYLKNLNSLLIRAKELAAKGLTTYLLTGGFQLPLKSITDSVFNDLIYIDKVIGIGEIGISDPYGSQPTVEEVIRIAANSKAVSTMSEKAGIIFIHIGPGSKGLKLISEVVNRSDLSINQFVITHVNRSRRLLEEAIEFAKIGGRIDITTGISPEYGIKGSISPHDALKQILENSVSINNITLSSDSGGFRCVDDNNCKIDKVLLSSETILNTIIRSVKIHHIDFAKALKTVTSNVSKIWNFYSKGEIKPYMDADLIFLDANYHIRKVMINGKIVFEK